MLAHALLLAFMVYARYATPIRLPPYRAKPRRGSGKYKARCSIRYVLCFSGPFSSAASRSRPCRSICGLIAPAGAVRSHGNATVTWAAVVHGDAAGLAGPWPSARIPSVAGPRLLQVGQEAGILPAG